MPDGNSARRSLAQTRTSLPLQQAFRCKRSFRPIDFDLRNQGVSLPRRFLVC